MAFPPQRTPPAGANPAGPALRAAQECEARGQLPEALSHYQRALAGAPHDAGHSRPILRAPGTPGPCIRRPSTACRKLAAKLRVTPGFDTCWGQPTWA